MKTLKTFQVMLFSLFTFFITTSANAQLYLLQEPTRGMEIQARQEAERWEDELSLTAKETSLMEEKILLYAIKRQSILQQNLPPKEELEQLTLLKIEETAGMRNILTKPQYDRYVMLLQQEATREEFVAQDSLR